MTRYVPSCRGMKRIREFWLSGLMSSFSASCLPWGSSSFSKVFRAGSQSGLPPTTPADLDVRN